MRARMLRAISLTALAVLIGGCFAKSHPDHERYEYLYINGIFQPPYTSFPSGTERGEWKCYDEAVNREYDCTFVRGGWNQYHYIYRARR